MAATVWLSWYHSTEGQAVLEEGDYQGKNIAAYRKWLGLRARAKVQGTVVSNGMWILWTMLQRGDIEKGVKMGEMGEMGVVLVVKLVSRRGWVRIQGKGL